MMPIRFIFHYGRAFALYGICYKNSGLSFYLFCLLKGIVKLLNAVAVLYVNNIPAEASETAWKLSPEYSRI